MFVLTILGQYVQYLFYNSRNKSSPYFSNMSYSFVFCFKNLDLLDRQTTQWDFSLSTLFVLFTFSVLKLLLKSLHPKQYVVPSFFPFLIGFLFDCVFHALKCGKYFASILLFCKLSLLFFYFVFLFFYFVSLFFYFVFLFFYFLYVWLSDVIFILVISRKISKVSSSD